MSKVNVGNGAVVGTLVGAVAVVTPGTTPVIDASLGNIFTLTPAQAESLSVINFVNGESLTLVVTTSGTSSFVLTFAAGFKTTGTLATGTVDSKVFVLKFEAVNGAMTEVARTTAM